MTELLEKETTLYDQLNSLYNEKLKNDVHFIRRENHSVTLTPMCLKQQHLHPKVQSKRNFKLFYCLEWSHARSSCEESGNDCVYNLIWYEPFASLICFHEGRKRVFVCFSPLLDRYGNETNLDLIFPMYTMCQNPKFTCIVRNRKTNLLELWNDKSGNCFAI